MCSLFEECCPPEVLNCCYQGMKYFNDWLCCFDLQWTADVDKLPCALIVWYVYRDGQYDSEFLDEPISHWLMEKVADAAVTFPNWIQMFQSTFWRSWVFSDTADSLEIGSVISFRPNLTICLFILLCWEKYLSGQFCLN